MDDPRLTPARPDLAAKYLEGKVEAARFVAGEEFEISDAIAPLREGPSSDAMLLTQALKGERVTIYDRNGEGCAWGQLNSDGYVGWLARSRAGKARRRADAQDHGAPDLCLSRALDQTAAGRDAGHGSACVTVMREDGAFAVTREGWYLPRQHVGGIDRHERRFRRGGRTLRRHALSVGRQEQPWHRLFRPGADRR